MSAPTPSPDSSHPTPSNAPTPVRPAAKRRRGLLYFGIAAVCVLLAAGIAVLIAARHGLNAFTSATPLVVSTSTLSAANEEQLDLKLGAFSERYDQGQTATLELSAPELNAVLATYTSLSTRISVSMTGGRLRAQVSVPLQLIVGAQGQGRWLNGEATLAIGTRDGQVHLQVLALDVNGRSLPRRLLDAVARVNLAAEAATHASTADYVRRVERITVEGEKLVIHFKAA